MFQHEVLCVAIASFGLMDPHVVPGVVQGDILGYMY